MSPTTARRSRGVLGAAIVLIVAVLALVGWLVWPTTPGPVALKTGTPQHIVTLTVDRLRIGDTAVDVTITDRAGASIDHAAVQLQAVQLLMGHAGAPVPLVAKGSGRFRADSVALMMTGPWELRLSIDTHHGVDQVTLPLWVGG